MGIRHFQLLVGSSALALVVAPPAAHAQDATASPVEPAVAAETGDEIVVSAIRQSIETAQAIKRDADQIVDSVVAEDIGKLPDVTASESLARISGVTVTRDGGLAQNVRVRGLPDLSTTYNGREVFTAEGRFVQLQDFPSNSIARIDVYKAASAELLEAGLAGLVDVRSRRPFDFKGTRIAGGIVGLHWYQSQRLGVEANGLVSTRWNTGIGEMGFLIEGSYAQTKFLDSARNVAQDIRNRTNIPGYPQLRYPNFVNFELNTGMRWRPNADFAFQWRPSSTLEIYLDGLFQGYRGEGDARNLQFVSGDLATLSNIELIDGTNQVRGMDAAAATGAVPSGAQQLNTEWTDTYQAGGGFIYKDGPLKLTGDVAFTDSTFTRHTAAFNFALASTPARHFEFDTPEGVGGGTVTLNNFDLYNAANYRWTGLTQSGNRGHGRSVQGRLDVDYKLDGWGISNLLAGVRMSTREAESYNYAPPNAPAPAGQLYTLLPLSYVTTQGGFRNDDVTSIKSFLVPTRESLEANIDSLRSRANLAQGTPAFGDPVFESSEKIYSGYLQARYAFDVGVPIDGLIGVRGTHTDVEVNGLRRGPTGATSPISQTIKTTDVLPNVSARIRFTPQLQMRLAFTKTRTRPGFGQLNPTVTIGALPAICATDPASADCIRSANSGNPDLEPIRSNNYDASLEYYFSRSGSITLGVFRKDLTGFINSFVTDVPDAEFGRLRLSRPQNGGDGRINGVEASARTFLRAPWLPDWLSNFGGLVNYTYLDAKSELSPDLAATRPGLQRIAGTSKHTLNVSAFYDSRWVSARLSYNRRSDFVASYNRVVDPALGPGIFGPALPILEQARGTLDFAGTLSPNENVTLTFNATNLLGSAVQNARQFNAAGQVYPWQTRFVESVYRVGVRFRF